MLDRPPGSMSAATLQAANRGARSSSSPLKPRDIAATVLRVVGRHARLEYTPGSLIDIEHHRVAA